MISTSSRAVTIGQWFALLVIAVIIVSVWWSMTHSERAEISSASIVSDRLEETTSINEEVAIEIAEFSVEPVADKTPTTGHAADGTLFVEHGATLILDKETLSESEPLNIEFRLDVPWVDDVNQRPLLMSPGNRHVRLEGRPQAGDNQRIRVEIPPEWLSTGRHVLQLKTNERNHMPIRRYALEVRVLESD